MRSVTKENITDTFLSYFGQDTDPRLRLVMESLVRHLHNFARETELTHDEWRKGVEFLQKVGEVTTPERNEFVLLSDVLGLSSMVDMLHSPEEGTNSSVLGPFHISGSPDLPIGGDLKGDWDGEVVLFKGRILDASGAPIAGAKLDVWQTAPNALYSLSLIHI